MAADFGGLIEDNDIHGAAVGVNYSASAALSGNRIHDNTTGVRVTVGGTLDGFGFVADEQPNEIYANVTGVELVGGRIQNQHIFNNTTGVAGAGTLGGDDLETVFEAHYSIDVN